MGQGTDANDKLDNSNKQGLMDGKGPYLLLGDPRLEKNNLLRDLTR